MDEMKSLSKCPSCNGIGTLNTIDFKQARTVKTQCNACGGTGYLKKQQTDGIRCGEVLGKTYFWQHLKDGHVIATLEIRVRPITMNGQPQFITNSSALFKKDKMQIRCYVEIVRMSTKPGFRRKGIMKQLVGNAIGDPKIEWAETSLEDSSEEGILLLKDLGFTEEGDKLIKELGFGKAD